MLHAQRSNADFAPRHFDKLFQALPAPKLSNRHSSRFPTAAHAGWISARGSYHRPSPSGAFWSDRF